MANNRDHEHVGAPAWLVRRVAVAPTAPGPLDGTAVAVKELVSIAGVELSANTGVELPPRWRHPDRDAAIVARLRAAGAHVVATTTTHELAWGITTMGGRRTVVNPHDPTRVAGGSSGGSAVAVATAGADLAVGTDTAGSVRIPAAWCGVLGWKAGRDAVPTDGVLPLAPLFDHVGLLAADPELLVRAVRAVAPGGAGIDRVVELRVERAVADERALFAVEACRRALRDLGLRDDAQATRVPAGTVDAFGFVQRADALRAHAELIGTWPDQAARYAPDIRARLEMADAADPGAVRDARDEIDRLRSALGAALRGAVAVLPVTGCAPPTVAAPDTVRIGDAVHPLRNVVLPWTVPANIGELPAVAVPWWIDGEPFGVQLLGGPGTDVALVEIAARLHARAPEAARAPGRRAPSGGGRDRAEAPPAPPPAW